jgi:pimeloyl-ACP methyl ester carboxylesterase
MRILKRTLAFLVIVYAALCVALYFEQSKLIFVPQREVQFTPKDFGCDFSEALFGPAEQSLHGWWLAADPKLSAQMGGRTLLYFHGNGGSIGANAQHACRLRNTGLNVFIFDYHGYGQSTGDSPTELSVFADADAAWSYLVGDASKHGRSVEPHKVVIYGHSLGGAIAVETAKRHPDANALIVESTFTSIRAMGDMSPQFKLFPLSLILNQKMDSLAKVREITMPTLFIHGNADEVIPHQMSEQLYAASHAPKELFIVPAAGHEDCAAIAGPKYQMTVTHFLQTRAQSQR